MWIFKRQVNFVPICCLSVANIQWRRSTRRTSCQWWRWGCFNPRSWSWFRILFFHHFCFLQQFKIPQSISIFKLQSLMIRIWMFNVFNFRVFDLRIVCKWNGSFMNYVSNESLIFFFSCLCYSISIWVKKFEYLIKRESKKERMFYYYYWLMVILFYLMQCNIFKNWRFCCFSDFTS